MQNDSYLALLDELSAALRPHVQKSVVTRLLGHAMRKRDVSRDDLKPKEIPLSVVAEMNNSLQMFIRSTGARRACRRALEELAQPQGSGWDARPTQEVVSICGDGDIVQARNRVRQIAQALGFDYSAQIRIATAVSEITRNIVMYAGEGTLTVTPVPGVRAGLRIVAQDNGPGIGDLETVLSGRYKSRTGKGLGLSGSKQLMDSFEVDSSPGKGTRITMVKHC